MAVNVPNEAPDPLLLVVRILMLPPSLFILLGVISLFELGARILHVLAVCPIARLFLWTMLATSLASPAALGAASVADPRPRLSFAASASYPHPAEQSKRRTGEQLAVVAR